LQLAITQKKNTRAESPKTKQIKLKSDNYQKFFLPFCPIHFSSGVFFDDGKKIKTW